MDWANGSAWKSPARWLGVVFGLAVCAADSGCAQLSSFGNKPTPPMLGATNSPRTDRSAKSAGGGDLYADRMRQSPSVLAALGGRKPAAETLASASPTSRSSTAAAAPSRSLDVALQPPVPVRDGAGKVAAGTAAAVVASRGLPGPKEAPKTASASRPGAAAKDPSGPTVATVVAAARARLDALKSYQVQLNRQERVGNTLLEPEDVLLSIRRDPKAVRLEWTDGPHKGREVIYVAGENGGLMHVNNADSVVPLPPMSMAPDSPLVLKSSRHPITEAGLDTIVANLEKTITLSGEGDLSRGRISYAGLENPGPLERPCHKLVRITPSGETWHVYLDPETKLPALVQATDLQGELLERYLFKDPQPDPSALASADAFDPDKRWGPPRGLLGRLARSRTAAGTTQQ